MVHRSFQLDPSAPDGPGEPTVEMLSGKYGMSVAEADVTDPDGLPAA